MIPLEQFAPEFSLRFQERPSSLSLRGGDGVNLLSEAKKTSNASFMTPSNFNRYGKPNNLFHSGSVHPCGIGEPRKAAQGGIGKKSAGAGRLTYSEDLPPRKTRARGLRRAL